MRKSFLRRIFSFAALVLAAQIISFSQNVREPIAVVDGQPIYDQDLTSVAGPRLLELRNQEYKIKSEALKTLIRKKLIEAEAKKKGLTPEQLLDQEVNSKIAEPSDAEARGYFLAIENHSALSFDAVQPQVKQFIKNAEAQQLRDKFEESLQTKADVSILLQPPLVDVGYDFARVKGNPAAPVTIVEFADFQCPFCQKAGATLNALLAKYDGQVKLAFLDFPLTEIHGQAGTAAEAARCAGQQGKFWEYHDNLLEDPAKLDETNLIGRARNLQLDESAFRSCLASGKFRHDIEANRERGTKAGVTGTPAYFINGTFLSGAQSLPEFEKIIDEKLTTRGKSKVTP